LVSGVLRACFEIGKSAAARGFGRGQGSEAGASPQRAVTAESTPAPARITAAPWVLAEKALNLTPGAYLRRNGFGDVGNDGDAEV
jgi:hypothetical protein